MLLRQDCNCPRQADLDYFKLFSRHDSLPLRVSIALVGLLAGRGGGGGGCGGGRTDLYFPIIPSFHSQDSMVDLGAMVSHVLYQDL